jgi:L-ascorbate metabolism protein UlaG (beta-lactamase superfamily)
VPAQHWSGRYIIDRNEALWAGYVISFDNSNVFFAGDTGFGPHFAAIKKRFGEFAMALLPIGAFLPRWFMQDNHLSPADAIKVAEIMQARVTIPMHFGTFALGDDGYTIAEQELRNLTRATPLKFTILAVGDGHSASSAVARTDSAHDFAGYELKPAH